MVKPTSKKEKMAKIIDFLGKTKFQIYNFLKIYGSLSLSEIAQKLKKSKSTIHGHIQKMKELDVVIEEKRPIYSDPVSNKPKVFENIYSMNPNFETQFNALLLELDPEKLTTGQAKTVIDVMLFMTKIRMMNLEIQKQFFEKINANIDENPEEMLNITKKLVYGLFNPKIEINDKDFPLISVYVNLSSQQFNKFSEDFGKLCKSFNSKEYEELSSDEKPVIFMGTGMPMKNFIEFLNT
ncbi:MAG: winged helix-turn-helix domain-containing protein [Candidatus Thorarchaeota archaeon]